MAVPFSSFPWILTSPESGQRIVYFDYLSVLCLKVSIYQFCRKQLTKWHSFISKLFLTKMQVNFSIFFYHGSLNVIGDKFRFVRSKLKSRLSVLCLKVSIYQFCRKQLTKLANLLMHSQCALSEPISSSRKTRKLTVCRFI
jgi:hypothetical protein